MPITEEDLDFVLSGGATNEDPNASLGGAISTEEGGVIESETMDNVFDDVTGDESKAGLVDYRGIYIKNSHATLTLQGAKLWITQDADSDDDATAVALADEAVGSAMESIADEITPPSGPEFTAPTTKEAGLTIGDIPAGSFKGIWIRRTITEGAAADDSVTFKVRVEGDSAA
jgi:hypothetical protein